MPRRRLAVVEPQQLDLFHIAEQIKEQHSSAIGAIANHALAIGELLLQAQIQVQENGLGWQEWVEGNLPFGIKQAAKYLKVAKDSRKLVKGASGAIPQSLEGLSLRAATKALMPPPEPVDRQQKLVVDQPFDLQREIASIIKQIEKRTEDWDQEDVDELADRLEAFADSIRSQEEKG